jgi:hypothetical protein
LLLIDSFSTKKKVFVDEILDSESYERESWKRWLLKVGLLQLDDSFEKPGFK